MDPSLRAIFREVNRNQEKVADIMRPLRAIFQDFFASEHGQDFHDSDKSTIKYTPEHTWARDEDSISVTYRDRRRPETGNEPYNLDIKVIASGNVIVKFQDGSRIDLYYREDEPEKSVVARIASAISAGNPYFLIVETFSNYTQERAEKAAKPEGPQR